MENRKSITLRGKEIFYCNANRSTYWYIVQQNKWEPETFDILDKYCRPGVNFIDIGAWVSSITIYANMCGAKVYSIEPDRICLNEGLLNQQANECIDILNFNIAISDNNGTQLLNSQTPNGMGNSESSLIVRANVGVEVPVNTVTLQTFLESQNLINKPLFIKMDVEGGEALIFPNSHQFLKNKKPTIYFSIHPAFLNDKYIKDIEDVIFDIYTVTDGRGKEYTRTSWNEELKNGWHSFLLEA